MMIMSIRERSGQTVDESRDTLRHWCEEVMLRGHLPQGTVLSFSASKGDHLSAVESAC